ncbi:MAG: cell division protein ZapD [Gammaproteobacteria bacterium]
MVSIPTADLFTQAAASSATGLYEQPLSERMRTFLRLEFLYQQLCFNVEQTSEWGSRAAIASMLDIVAILGRGDVRGDVLKELERQIAVYDRYQNLAGVDEVRLKRVLRNLQDLRQRLFAVGPQFLQLIRDSEFLAAIKHRSAIPGGTCEFDLPDYAHWLNHHYEQRVADIERWMGNLRPLCESIAELLWLLRESGQTSDQVATNGTFQHGMIGEGVAGLLRVSLPADVNLYPEISGSHHRFTIRFMQSPDALQRPTQANKDVRFRLTIC